MSIIKNKKIISFSYAYKKCCASLAVVKIENNVYTTIIFI